MESLIALAKDPAAWLALATLIAMEVVLGVDNLIFVSILTNNVRENRRTLVRRIGLSVALIFRLALACDCRVDREIHRADILGLWP